MGKILAVHSFRGGTGKSLVAVTLASILAREGDDICLMDLDFRAPTLHTAFRAEGVKCWLNDYLNGNCEVGDMLIDFGSKLSTEGRLAVALADPSTEAIREMSMKDRKWEMRALGRLLSMRSVLFDEKAMEYTIVDTSPGIQYSSINAIVSSDLVLIVTSPSEPDLEGTERMLREMYSVFQKKTAVLVNRVPEEMVSREKEEYSNKIATFLASPVLGVIPCYCDILRTNNAIRFALDNPKHQFTTYMQDVAEKIRRL